MYKWDAKEYNRSSSAQYKWAKELIDKLHLRGDERLLDIGCGDGKITAEIARQLPDGSVLGIDRSREMIEFAQGSFSPADIPNLRFAVMDASDLQFDAEFDVVVSFACLHWIVDHKPVIAGIKRSLRPSGRILIQFGGRGNASGFVEVVEEMISEPEWSSFFHDFSFPYGFHGPVEYAEWLLDAGLNPVRVELIEKDMVQESRDALLGWIRTTWLPYLQRVPEDLRDRFAQEFADRYIAVHPANGDGRIHAKMMRLEVEAMNGD